MLELTVLVKKEKQLQEEARNVTKELDLQKLLSPYGQLQEVGSSVYGLMTWRDIDYDLITKNTPSKKEYWVMAQKLFTKQGVKSLTLSNNLTQNDLNRPKSMYIGIKYQNKLGNSWKIDIRLLAKAEVTTDKIANLIADKLTPQTRLIILKIKSQVHDHPKYHKDFSSTDIYEAVLLHGIKTVDEFYQYLGSLGKLY